MFNYNIFSMPEPKRIYIARPNNHRLGQMNGINSAKISIPLQSMWTIDFDVDKYLDQILNPIYNMLNPLMEIYVEDIGWFRIDEQPREIENPNERIYKEFTANGIETQLVDIDVIDFYINCGIDASYEMYEENLDALGIPKNNIRLYIPNSDDDPNSDNYWSLGVLNILEKLYLKDKGWSIGHVDVGISSQRRNFEIQSITCYDLLINEISTANDCIILFDRIEKVINVYDIKNFGKAIPIELNYRNLLNQAEVSPQSDMMYTRLNVAGANENTLISYYNFGSNSIFDLSYPIHNSNFDEGFINKYDTWIEYREQFRDEFAETFREYLRIQNEIKKLENLLPIDHVSTNWNAYTVDELKVELSKFEAMEKRLRELNTIGEEVVINNPQDNALYISIKEVIIPDIKSEIERQEAGSNIPSSDLRVDYKYKWDLYGIVGLESRRKVVQNAADILKANGYNEPWSESSTETEQLHNKNYNDYLNQIEYLNQIDQRLEILNAKVIEYNNQIEINTNHRSEIISNVNVSNERFNFTEDEIKTINVLFRDTDFTDSSIEVLENTNVDDLINSSKELYVSAKKELDIRCRPQFIVSINSDNFLQLNDYTKSISDINTGDFIFIELDGGIKTKQRLVNLSFELVNFNDTDINMDFSEFITTYSEANDYRYLKGTNNSISKNSITREAQTYFKQLAVSSANNVLNTYFGGSGSGGGMGGLIDNLSSADLLKLSDMLSGLVNGRLELEQLKAKLAKIDTLEADSVFTKYLESQFLVSNQAQFNELDALVAKIQSAIMGTSATETGIIVNLTSDNATINEALIKQVIASYIAVGDLKAGNIDTDQISILSNDGTFKLVGNTMQFADKDGNIRIQIGQDANGDFTFELYGEDGKGVLLDQNGLHDSAISDGQIKNDMLAGGITQDKLGFNAVVADENGKIDSGLVLIDGQGLDAKFVTIEKTIDSSIVYRIEIHSTNGNLFKNGDINTILSCHVYKGNVEITDEINTSRFHWTKKDKNGNDDETWNAVHFGGTKSIVVTKDDVYLRANFSCSVDGIPF